MKIKKVFLIIPFLFLIMGMGGCEREQLSENCYEGKILYLSEECFNIVEIISSPKDGMPVGNTIAFNPDLFNKKLKEGDVIHIEITDFIKRDYPVASPCVYPIYFGIVKPCK